MSKCILKNLRKGEAKELPDIIISEPGKKIIGRNPETLIESSSVSREHLVIKPKFEEKMILIRFIGKSPAALNGFVMKQEEAYEAQQGDILSLVYGSDYCYEVTFEEEQKGSFKAKRPSEDELMSDTQKRSKSEEDKWVSVENGKCYVFTSKGVDARDKIASYDMDGTLIKTVSGNVFPKNVDDWQLNYEKIPRKLKSLHENGFKIVIFTNQAGIESGKSTIEDIKRKIFMIQQRLEVPLQAFVATSSSMFRKPRTKMWEALEEKFNDGVAVDRNQSFYVGDAAGRAENKFLKKKKDHSCADRLYALNLGLSFYTPEEHFLNAKDASKHWNKPAFNPTNISDGINLIEPSGAKLISEEQEMVLMVGFPGSGKSFFSHEYFKKEGYEVINRDTLNSQSKCVAAIEAAVTKKKSCVIDNTNPDPASRKRYVEEAKRLKVPIRCFVFTTNYEHSKHNNMFRQLTDSTHMKINEMVFNIYKKKYVEPSIKEGFHEIVKVNFVPKFKDVESEKLYKMYLLEK